MKKETLCLAMTICTMSCFSQTTTVNYLDKCSTQRKTAWVFAGTGIALATAGFLITEIDGTGEKSVLSENFDVGAGLFLQAFLHV